MTYTEPEVHGVGIFELCFSIEGVIQLECCSQGFACGVVVIFEELVVNILITRGRILPLLRNSRNCKQHDAGDAISILTRLS